MKTAVAILAVAILATAAFGQSNDPVCQMNPYAPPCQPQTSPYGGGQQLNRTPDQIERTVKDYSDSLQRQRDAELRRCEIRAEHEYQECVRAGRSYCSMPACY